MAGLKNGDVITKVDDVVVDGSESLVATIRGHRPGESVEITYLRDGKTAHDDRRARVGREHPGLLTRLVRRVGVVRRSTCRRVSGDVLPPV